MVESPGNDPDSQALQASVITLSTNSPFNSSRAYRNNGLTQTSFHSIPGQSFLRADVTAFAIGFTCLTHAQFIALSGFAPL